MKDDQQARKRKSIHQRKARQLKKEQDDFQRKYQNNAFLSPERAQQEYQRLEKRLPTCKNMLKDWKTKICWNNKKC